ncbi:uncharacterized protein LOC116301510 isoform X2 [Actinia tenebrosa]|uniref:Uncharacterized protein LOC116301510 isoform X2 n=1 Tax=Actinia tenebrosa TaxID=6105 RepID=A0A6P8IHW7_ACTTE|nr:uncharacterized protein LOC116301510 isoform X2 [Actinia tenebrosa]
MVSLIQNRTCSTPVELDIDFHEGANETVVSAFVSPSRPRYFVLPYKLFQGIKNLYIEVTPIYGTVGIYASRNLETPGPQNYTYKIDPLNDREQMVLYISDPCEGYSNTTCPNVYLAIYGDSSTLSCSERFCTLPNQIKFTIKKGVKPAYGTACSSFHKSVFLAIGILIVQTFNHVII